MKFDVLNRHTGAVQFTADIECSDKETHSFKLGLAVKWAIKNNANLRHADLSSADLSSANLSSADLRYADLRYADLSSADLSSANLSSADLRYANLSVIKTNIWTVYVQLEYIRIGCQYHTVKEWLAFSDDEISAMGSSALKWWKQWKPVIKASHKALVNIKKNEGR